MLQVKGRVGVADPLRVCGDLLNPLRLRGRIAILERGDCMFVEKVCERLCCVSSFEPYMTVFLLSELGNVFMCFETQCYIYWKCE
jgi:hypothetical protein